MAVAGSACPEGARIAIPLQLSADLAPEPSGLSVEASGRAMGVAWTLRAVSRPDLPPPLLGRVVQQALDQVVQEMSPWAPDTVISAYHRAAAGAWVVLPDAFAQVMECGIGLAQASDGAFDPTLGRLTDLWGFGPPGPVDAPPSAGAVTEALAASGWWRLVFERQERRLLQPGGLRLDLSGIAKGFAVDHAAAALRRVGLRHFLLEVGGELRGEGVKADGQPWWVALERLEGEAPDQAPLVLALCGQSVATSGDYRRFLVHEGERLSHTLDPRTGWPAQSGVAAVSVVHQDAMLADAWCTILSVLGPEEGLALAQAQGLAARLLVYCKRGLEERLTPAFQALLD